MLLCCSLLTFAAECDCLHGRVGSILVGRDHALVVCVCKEICVSCVNIAGEHPCMRILIHVHHCCISAQRSASAKYTKMCTHARGRWATQKTNEMSGFHLLIS